MEVSFNGAKVQGKLTDLRVTSVPVYSEDRKTVVRTMWKYEMTLEETHETPLPALGAERADEPAVVGPELQLDMFLGGNTVTAAIDPSDGGTADDPVAQWDYNSESLWTAPDGFQTAVNSIMLWAEGNGLREGCGCFFHVSVDDKDAFTSNREYVLCCAGAHDALDPAPKYDPETGLLWYFYGCRLVLDR